MNKSSRNIITVKQLVKLYKGSHEEALKGIDLFITEGDFLGLLGPNSAGKTTIISILCGLLKITQGEVFVNNVDVKKYPAKIKRLIGLIPQELALYPTLTVKENLKYFGSLHGIHGVELQARVEECLAVVELHSHANKIISKCSGGIKRRVNLVSGLIHNPMIVFLDEPTLGVDAQSRNLIFEYLKMLNDKGMTLIYTTHYMEEAQNLCSKVIIIDDGNIVENGVPAELIEKYSGCRDLGQVFLELTGKSLRE